MKIVNSLTRVNIYYKRAIVIAEFALNSFLIYIEVWTRVRSSIFKTFYHVWPYNIDETNWFSHSFSLRSQLRFPKFLVLRKTLQYQINNLQSVVKICFEISHCDLICGLIWYRIARSANNWINTLTSNRFVTCLQAVSTVKNKKKEQFSI